MSRETSGCTDAFTFAVLSDVHLYVDDPADSDSVAYRDYQKARLFADTRERFMRTADRVNACGPQLVLITGDLIDHLSAANVRLYSEMITRLSAETLSVAGNHDHTTLVVHSKAGTAFDPCWNLEKPGVVAHFWQGVFPGDRFDYALTRWGFRFIIVDNGRNQLSEQQLVWLEQELRLAPEGRAILFNHVPLRTPQTLETVHRGWGGNESLLIPRSDPQFELLVAYRAKISAVFSGHLHTFSDDTEEGLRQIVCPISPGAPGNFLLVRGITTNGALHVDWIEHRGRQAGRASPASPAG